MNKQQILDTYFVREKNEWEGGTKFCYYPQEGYQIEFRGQRIDCVEVFSGVRLSSAVLFTDGDREGYFDWNCVKLNELAAYKLEPIDLMMTYLDMNTEIEDETDVGC